MLELVNYNKQCQSDINTLLNSFFRDFSINFFIYRSFLQDGRIIYLTNNYDWLLHRVEKLPWTSCTLKKEYHLFLEKNFSCFLWAGQPDTEDLIYNHLYNFDIWNGLSIYEKYNNDLNIWGFASTLSNNTVLDLYINKTNLFAEWISAFKTTRVYLNRFNSILKLDESSFIPKKYATSHNHDIKKYSRAYNINISHTEINVTKRELESILLLSKGLSVKQVSAILQLSPRTVETYINSLKTKTNYSSTSTLIEDFLKNPLNKILSQ